MIKIPNSYFYYAMPIENAARSEFTNIHYFIYYSILDLLPFGSNYKTVIHKEGELSF
jgi:hypothetical protein